MLLGQSLAGSRLQRDVMPFDRPEDFDAEEPEQAELQAIAARRQAAELEGVLSSGILGTLTFLAPTNEGM